ncbi:serine/threonine protein kinase, partial [Candidatus Sumerlaeota bacterium]|nr:serine/threonine protein kinase [Candidatus Sumerlaeota bacterium]
MSEPTTDNAPSRFTLESLIGQTLDDRYVVDEMIGLGAMGAVFRGRHLRLRRTVALKVPRPELSTKAGFLGRFEREALTMAKLVQENIVQVFDVCISENPEQPSFIAMEYIEGVELEQYLFSQDSKLTVSAVMDLFFQIARGLDAAHERGIIHRDIKPKNICVTLPQRVAKIMDFGVAKLEMEDVYETVAEAAIGTPAYMAPEQITGDSLTPAADIYGLAMTLYHCLTRKLPFEAQSASNMLFAHVSSAPIPAHVRNPSLPIKVHKALAPALAKNPKDRPKTARALVLAVYQALEHLANRSFGDLFSGALDATQTPRKEALEGEATVVDLPSLPWLKMTTKTRKHTVLGGAGGILLLFILIFSFGGRSKKKVSEGARSGSGPQGKELVEAAAVPTPLPPLEKPESAPPPPPTPVITATETPADQP